MNERARRACAVRIDELRDDWHPSGIRATLERLQYEQHLSDKQVIVAILQVAENPTARTPAAAEFPAHLEIIRRLFTDSPTGEPADTSTASGVYCDHGVDTGLRTSSGATRCPSCRGVTRAQRNSHITGYTPGPARIESRDLRRSKPLERMPDATGRDPVRFADAIDELVRDGRLPAHPSVPHLG